jgi:hypothetical protein
METAKVEVMSQSDAKSDDLLRDKNVRGMLGGHEVGPGRKPCSALSLFLFLHLP